ncbi:hypothetical protein ACQP0I_03110 [Micromonospora carbonacea]|uniref:hypothetical protein n=1 Tax=Micromonospora carbonacea TaxID=47853 RepID=UPI003D952DE0
MTEILIANASGAVTGTHTVAATTAPVRGLLPAARANWMWLVGAGFLGVMIAYLETFDNDEVNKSIKEWGDAARLLGTDQFGAALGEVPPSAEEWDFDDRDAFELFLRKLGAEINSLAEAFNANKESLTAARDAFNDAVDALVEALIPILIAVIASVALQAFPPTAPIAEAIGVAGLTVSVAILALVFGDISALFTTVMAGFQHNNRFAFVSDSRPGWAATGTDPDIKDIKIDWVKDSKFYQ